MAYTETQIEELVKALGGKERADEILHEKLFDSIRGCAELTVQGMLNKVTNDGMSEAFLSMPCTLVATLLLGLDKKVQKNRLSKDNVQQIQQGILDFVSSNPKTKIKNIANYVGFPTPKVAAQIRKLIAKGLIGSEGEKAGTVYFLTQSK